MTLNDVLAEWIRQNLIAEGVQEHFAAWYAHDLAFGGEEAVSLWDDLPPEQQVVAERYAGILNGVYAGKDMTTAAQAVPIPPQAVGLDWEGLQASVLGLDDPPDFLEFDDVTDEQVGKINALAQAAEVGPFAAIVGTPVPAGSLSAPASTEALLAAVPDQDLQMLHYKALVLANGGAMPAPYISGKNYSKEILALSQKYQSQGIGDASDNFSDLYGKILQTIIGHTPFTPDHNYFDDYYDHVKMLADQITTGIVYPDTALAEVNGEIALQELEGWNAPAAQLVKDLVFQWGEDHGVATPLSVAPSAEDHLEVAVKNIVLQDVGLGNAATIVGDIMDAVIYGDGSWHQATESLSPQAKLALHKVVQDYGAGAYEPAALTQKVTSPTPAFQNPLSEAAGLPRPSRIQEALSDYSDLDLTQRILDPQALSLLYEEGYVDETEPTPRNRLPYLPTATLEYARKGALNEPSKYKDEGLNLLNRILTGQGGRATPPQIPWETVRSGIEKEADKFHIPAYQALFADLDALQEQHPGIHEAFLLRDMEKAYPARLAQLRARGVKNPERFVHPVNFNRTLRDLTTPGGSHDYDTMARYLRLHHPEFMAAPHWVFVDSGYSGTIPSRIMEMNEALNLGKNIDVRMLSSSSAPWQAPSVLDIGIPRDDIVEKIEHTAHRRGTIEGLDPATLQPYAPPVTPPEEAMVSYMERYIRNAFEGEPFRYTPRVFAEPRSLVGQLAALAEAMNLSRQSPEWAPGFPDLLMYDTEHGPYGWYDLDGGRNAVDVSRWEPHPDYTAPHSNENPAIVLQHPETGQPFFVKSTRNPMIEALGSNLYRATGLPSPEIALAKGMPGARHQQQLITPYLPGMKTLKEVAKRGSGDWRNVPAMDHLSTIGADSWLLNQSQHGKQFLLPENFDSLAGLEGPGYNSLMPGRQVTPTHIDFGETFSTRLPWASETWWEQQPFHPGNPASRNLYDQMLGRTGGLLDPKLTRSDFLKTGRLHIIPELSTDEGRTKFAESLERPSTIPAPLIHSLVKNHGFSPEMAQQLVRRAQAMAGTAQRIRQNALPGFSGQVIPGMAGGLAALALLGLPAEAATPEDAALAEAAGGPNPLLYGAGAALFALDPKDWRGGVPAVQPAPLEDQLRMYRAGATKLPATPGAAGGGFRPDPNMVRINPAPTFREGLGNLFRGAASRLGGGTGPHGLNAGLAGLDLALNPQHYQEALEQTPLIGSIIRGGREWGEAVDRARAEAREDDLRRAALSEAAYQRYHARKYPGLRGGYTPEGVFDYAGSSGGSW